MKNYYELEDFKLEGRDTVEIRDGRVYDLQASIIKSNNPMIMEPRRYRGEELTKQDLKRAVNLAQVPPNTGHDCYLKGISVKFDVNFIQSVWQQFKRYTWFDFISSCSTMHRIAKMNLGDQQCDCSYLAYVLDVYNETTEFPTNLVVNDKLVTIDNKRDLFEEVSKAIPSGFRLWGSITTNYLQLKTIYAQRKNHKLSDARNFCKWVETLPMSELITGINK